jgi:hypothetical protein
MLYLVQLNQLAKNKTRRIALIGVKTFASIWHRRLGHPKPQVLQHMFKTQLLISSLNFSQSLCVLCQLAKSRQLTFQESRRVTSSPVELNHSDIWTSLILLLSGCKFYAIFINAFSRYSWLFFLR